MLIVDGNLFAPLLCSVVVISTQLFKKRLKGMVVNPPVKIQNLWLIFINQFTGAHKPVLKPFFTCTDGISICCRFVYCMAVPFRTINSGSVKISVLFIIYITVKCSAHIHKEIMLGSVC